MTGLEHEADGSWLVPLLLFAAICWQLWLSLRYTKPSDTDAEADNKSATAWPFPADLAGLYRDRRPAAPTPHGDAPPRDAPFASAVRDIRAHDHDFDLERFLDGSQTAYEAIVTAFIKGDSDALKPLLTPEVHGAYAAAIATRTDDDKCTKTALVRLAKPQLLDVAVRDGYADIRIRFVATWLSVRAGQDAASDGVAIANAARDTVDEWTFTRPLASLDPNWRLAASN